MTDIASIIDWFQAHWPEIQAAVVALGQAIASIVAVASVIVRYTPTLKDDTILLAVVKFLGKYLAFNPTVDHDAIRASLNAPTPPASTEDAS